MKKNLKNTSNHSTALTFTTANGSLPYTLMNDYLFHAVFLNNHEALKRLICSLLHLHYENIISLITVSPIDIGKHILDKEIILDIKLVLNDDTTIDLEMQVKNEHNWPERSLIYTCRTFSSLNKGEAYADVKSVIHIGFLNFELFPDNPEFYSIFQLLNAKNYKKYSDKFTISVINLNRTDLATDEDKAYNIDYWARLFKATTWEEIRMLAEKNEGIREAGETMFRYVYDDYESALCEMREEYRRRARTEEIFRERERAQFEAEMQQAKLKLNATRAELTTAQAELHNTQSELHSTQSELHSTEEQLNNANNKITEQELEIARLRTELESIKNQ